jgi:hypothetical protein
VRNSEGRKQGKRKWKEKSRTQNKLSEVRNVVRKESKGNGRKKKGK